MRCECQQTPFHGRARPYRSQHCGHELVRLLGLHEAAHLQHANGQAGYDGGVLGQGLLQHLAVLLVVLERANLGHAAKALKGAQVRLVHMGEMRVGDDDVGQSLDVTKAVRQSTFFSKGTLPSTPLHLPRRQLEATVVGRVYQTRLGEGPPEKGQLAQADRPGLTLHPSGALSTGGSVSSLAVVLLVQRRRRPPRWSDGGGMRPSLWNLGT